MSTPPETSPPTFPSPPTGLPDDTGEFARLEVEPAWYSSSFIKRLGETEVAHEVTGLESDGLVLHPVHDASHGESLQAGIRTEKGALILIGNPRGTLSSVARRLLLLPQITPKSDFTAPKLAVFASCYDAEQRDYDRFAAAIRAESGQDIGEVRAGQAEAVTSIVETILGVSAQLGISHLYVNTRDMKKELERGWLLPTPPILEFLGLPLPGAEMPNPLARGLLGRLGLRT